MVEDTKNGRVHAFFTEFSTHVAKWTGSHWAFFIAAILVVISLSLVGVDITNIGISIVTLLMVFILQNTQNRDSAALHLKLDEVVRVEPEARDDVQGVESRSEEEIEELHLDEPDGTPLGDRAESGTEVSRRGGAARSGRSRRADPDPPVAS
jgi:low affinity Fe/Cu permease